MKPIIQEIEKVIREKFLKELKNFFNNTFIWDAILMYRHDKSIHIPFCFDKRFLHILGTNLYLQLPLFYMYILQTHKILVHDMEVL